MDKCDPQIAESQATSLIHAWDKCSRFQNIFLHFFEFTDIQVSIPNEKSVDLPVFHVFICPLQCQKWNSEPPVYPTGALHGDTLLVQALIFGHQDNAQKLSDIQNPSLVRFYFHYVHVSFSSFSIFTIDFLDNPGSLQSDRAQQHQHCLHRLHTRRSIFLVIKFACSNEHFSHIQSSGFHFVQCVFNSSPGFG